MKTQSGVAIIKADGDQEVFDSSKLLASLLRAGAKEDVAASIVEKVKDGLVNGMTTEDIYRHAFALLSHERKPVAARYSLRRSLAALGPSGFPFERFIAEILKRKGYETAVGQIVNGTCVPHEIDVAAWTPKELIFIEAKFHNEYNVKSDLKVALYVKARFDDLREPTFTFGGEKHMTEGWLVTNTKFTTTAIQYAECTGTKLIGWNYPAKGNLQDMIEESGLHPITCLTTLKADEKRELLQNGVVLCSNVRERQVLSSLRMDPQRVSAVLEESTLLCPIEA